MEEIVCMCERSAKRCFVAFEIANPFSKLSPILAARTKCITMEKNYDFFVRHLAQLQNSGLNALQKKAPFITKKVMDLVVYLLAGLNAVLFYFVILEKVMDLVVYLLAGLNAVLF